MLIYKNFANKSNSIGFKKYMVAQLRQHIMNIVILLVAMVTTGIITGMLTAEAFRRITQAIFDKSALDLLHALLFFICVVLINFLSTILYKTNLFRLKREITVSCEDELFGIYKEQEYWLNAGEVLGQIRKNIPSVIDSTLTLLNTTLQTGTIIISGSIYAATLNYIVLITAFIIMCVMLLFSYRSLKRLNNIYAEFGKSQGELYNRLWEQVKNREIARFLIHERASEPYMKESRKFLNMLSKAKRISNIAELFSSFGSSLMIILTAVIGGTFVLKNILSMAELLALIIVIPKITSNMFLIPSIITGWKSVIGQSEPIRRLFNKKAKAVPQYIDISDEITKLSVQNLCFSYYENSQILNNVSLEISEGIYAISGISGCGKTTFIKILAKLLPHKKGMVLVNSKLLANIDRDCYWQKIIYVSQKPVILKDTLLYNITMSQSEYDENRLQAAIKDAQLEQFLQSQPKGLQTVISSDTISKGEEQKISMARVFYRKAQVLLLDEVTSAMDPKSETEIMKAIKNRVHKEYKIVLYISHRMEPLHIADEVIFFQNGKIGGKGKHEILLENDDHYRSMVEEMYT